MSKIPPFYQFKLPLLSGEKMDFHDLQNKVVLIVNIYNFVFLCFHSIYKILMQWFTAILPYG